MLAGPASGGRWTLLVRREWLRRHEPELFRTTVAGEEERPRRALEQLEGRTIEWRQRSTDERLQGYLDQALQEVRERLAEIQRQPPPPSRILLIEVPAGDVFRQHLQPPDTRRLLALAWLNNLADPEQQAAAAVLRKLTAMGVDVDGAQPDLSDQLGTTLLDDRQWAAKVGLVEYQILGKPHFQGTGGVLVREDSVQGRPGLGQLLGGLLTEQLEGQLAELLNPQPGARAVNPARSEKAFSQAIREAEAEGARGLRITELDQVRGRQVTVKGTFLARMPDGAWKAVWQQAASVDPNGVKAETLDQLAADPTIAEALDQMRKLGLNPDADLVRLALRHGAATQEALNVVNRDFGQFMLMHTRSLEGPPLILPDR
jgi:hypothetical protein